MALTDDLISYWKLDESSGNATDAHGTNTLTDNNTVGSATGVVSGARSFASASSEFLAKTSGTGHPLTSDIWTIALWAKPADVTGVKQCFFFGQDSAGLAYGVFIYRDGSTWTVELGDGVGQIAGGTATTGVWSHVAAIYDGLFLHLFVDGVEVGSTFVFPDIQDGRIVVGAYYDGAAYQEHWNGDLDEIGLWSRMLNSFEIQALCNSGSGLAYPLKQVVEVLIVGGGGGGGKRIGGGGGAGGYAAVSAYAVTGTGFTVTVGNGGAGIGSGGAGHGGRGSNGEDSVFGSITVPGGGGGGHYTALPNGSSGGSGGGAGLTSGLASGTPGSGGTYGNDGGSGAHDGGANYCGGGGGGYGGVGANSVSGAPAAGGAGWPNSISGTEVYYAGGGGAGGATTDGAGGTGGGGAGGGADRSGTNGTANTGGGGGAARNNTDVGTMSSGNGGSGIVIVSYVTADFGNCTGGTKTINGSKTVHTFTSNGTFKAVLRSSYSVLKSKILRGSA